MVPLSLLIALCGGLLWASASVNARFRPGDAVWQRTQRKLVAAGKGVLTTGAILLGLVLLVSGLTALVG